MISAEIQTRVRYGETDQMGYVYYGNYALYFEIGRTELMRKMGFPYRRLEDYNIFLPVLSLQIQYLQPAKYDDLLTIRTSLTEPPGVKITFHYEIFNQDGKKLTQGHTVLAFMNAQTRKPCRPDPQILALLSSSFE